MTNFRENHQQAAVVNVIFYAGTNYLPRDFPNGITTKISKSLLNATKKFPNTSIYFSAALSKFKNTLFEMINHMNSKIFEFSSFHHQLSLI